MVLEKEVMSGLVAGLSEDARDDMVIELTERDSRKQSEHIYFTLSHQDSSKLDSGKYKSQSIPKLIVTTTEDSVSSSSLTVTGSRDKTSREKSLSRGQRSKSEGQKEFDEREEKSESS